MKIEIDIGDPVATNFKLSPVQWIFLNEKANGRCYPSRGDHRTAIKLYNLGLLDRAYWGSSLTNLGRLIVSCYRAGKRA